MSTIEFAKIGRNLMTNIKSAFARFKAEISLIGLVLLIGYTA